MNKLTFILKLKQNPKMFMQSLLGKLNKIRLQTSRIKSVKNLLILKLKLQAST